MHMPRCETRDERPCALLAEAHTRRAWVETMRSISPEKRFRTLLPGNALPEAKPAGLPRIVAIVSSAEETQPNDATAPHRMVVVIPLTATTSVVHEVLQLQGSQRWKTIRACHSRLVVRLQFPHARPQAYSCHAHGTKHPTQMLILPPMHQQTPAYRAHDRLSFRVPRPHMLERQDLWGTRL